MMAQEIFRIVRPPHQKGTTSPAVQRREQTRIESSSPDIVVVPPLDDDDDDGTIGPVGRATLAPRRGEAVEPFGRTSMTTTTKKPSIIRRCGVGEWKSRRGRPDRGDDEYGGD